MTARRILTRVALAAALVATPTGGTTAAATTTPSTAEQVHALGCVMGAAPGYGDRAIRLRDGHVERWRFDHMIDEMLAHRFFFMVGNCPQTRST